MPPAYENHARELLRRLANATPLQPASPLLVEDEPVIHVRVVTTKTPKALKVPQVDAFNLMLSHTAATGIASLSKLFLFALKKQNAMDPDLLQRYEKSLGGALEAQVASFEAMQATIAGALSVEHQPKELQEFSEKLWRDVQAVVDGCQGLVDEELAASDDPLTPARLRGAQYRNAVLQREDMLSAQQAAELIGVSRQSITDKRHAGQLFALLWGTRFLKYPAWQFEPQIFGEPLRKVLEAIKEEDAWSIYRFFLTPDSGLEGKTPLEMLRTGDIDRAVLTATRFADRD